MNYVPVPNHPYALYAYGYDQFQRFWNYFMCKKCGDTTARICSNPDNLNLRVFQYASLHVHRGE